MREEFIRAITTHQTAFGLDLSDHAIERLADHYELVMEHNPLLHLVAPSSPEEFAIRHILESLTLLEYLPKKAKFADVGTGAGLPSIPCLLVREDIKGMLIETKEKKSMFLGLAVETLKIADRSMVINKQFQEVDTADVEFVTCRALDKFTEKLPRLVKWSGKRRMLLFGGPILGETLQRCGVHFSSALMPMSTQRFLYVSDPS